MLEKIVEGLFVSLAGALILALVGFALICLYLMWVMLAISPIVCLASLAFFGLSYAVGRMAIYR